MKKVLTLTAFAFTTILFAQTETKSKKNDVPDVVKKAFQKDYPSQPAKWEKENGGYEAEFKMNGSEASAVYDKNGHKKEFEIEIKASELPNAASDYLKKNYPIAKIKEAAKITDDKNTVTYE